MKSINPSCEDCLKILIKHQIGTFINRKQKNLSYLIEQHFSKETKERLSSAIHQTRDDKKKKAYQKKYYQANREKILNYIKKCRREDYQYNREYYQKRKLKRIDIVFEFFGYSVDFLNEIERNVGIIWC